jgi:hypothetical protein
MNRISIVQNQLQLEQFYYYDNKKKCPRARQFPCIVIETDIEGGLGGDYMSYQFVYFSKFATSSQIKGIIQGIQIADKLFNYSNQNHLTIE